MSNTLLTALRSCSSSRALLPFLAPGPVARDVSPSHRTVRRTDPVRRAHLHAVRGSAAGVRGALGRGVGCSHRLGKGRVRVYPCESFMNAVYFRNLLNHHACLAVARVHRGHPAGRRARDRGACGGRMLDLFARARLRARHAAAARVRRIAAHRDRPRSRPAARSSWSTSCRAACSACAPTSRRRSRASTRTC